MYYKFSWSLLVIASSLLFAAPALTQAAEIPLPLKCLWASYRNFRISDDGKMIRFADGTEMPFESEQLDPDFTDRDNPVATNIAQMFTMPYPMDRFQTPKTGADDPGRIRYEPLFRKLYGNSSEQVKADLVRVRWAVDGSTVLFNRRFGAAAALEKVSQEIAALARKSPQFTKFVKGPLGGTFLWRKIAGSPNLSVHSFGIAIDINTTYSDYWRWSATPDGAIRYRNRIPLEIAEIFERHGFVWGGKWFHYDTMHFEYRPELTMSPAECEAGFREY